jgi:protein-disulfide isomerase
MKHRYGWHWLFASFLFLGLLAACGPAAPDTSMPQVAEPNEDAVVAEGEEAGASEMAAVVERGSGGDNKPAEEGRTALVIDSSRVEQDAAGIEVGFTQEGRPYRGDPGAAIVIEEFSDFQCPFCGRFATETLPSLLENQIAGGDAVFVYYDFPLTSIHPQAVAAANAARCAGDQGAAAYWAMHDHLFDHLGEWGNNRANQFFTDYAADIGLTLEPFTACLEEETYFDEVRADLALGQSRGVRSTPSFFLNGQPLVGAQPVNVFNEAIATLMAGESIVEEAPEAPAPGALPTPVAIALDDAAATLGSPEAQVTIVEFTDYQCPFCARHSMETLPSIINELVETGRVYYVLKDLPLDMHPIAPLAATAARCAGEQEAYWEMHDLLFEQQEEWSNASDPTAVMANIAAELELNQADFATCLDSGKYDEVIQANMAEAISYGMTGTPGFFIDGYPLSGAQPFELFAYAVELAELGELAEAYRPREQQQQQPPPEPTGPVEVSEEGAAFVTGDPNAPVTIVEFTDYQCPFCARHASQTMPQIKANFVDTGQARYVIMDFPIVNNHPQAAKAAEAARCAGDQDAYLAMHEAIFVNQQQWSGNTQATSLFIDYAEQIGLDTAVFAECLEGGRYETAVLANLQTGVELGIRGTPSFFLNGYFVNGAQPYELFEQAIGELAADSGR